MPSPSSPSDSSISSSDFDTESTGSFFHDRSTSLGTLMGVTLQAITFRAASRRLQQENSVSVILGGQRSKKRRRVRGVLDRRRWRWLILCREDNDDRRASLGDYLEEERRFDSCGAALELEEGIILGQTGNGRALFAEGRVLPPVQVVEKSERSQTSTGRCLFSAVAAAVERCSLCSVV